MGESGEDGPASGEDEPASGEDERAEPAQARWYLRGSVLLTAGVLLTALAVVAAVLAIRGRDEPARDAGTESSAARGDVPAAAEAFLAGATSAITAVTAYDYRSLDSALSSGLYVTTGPYREAYRAALTGAAAARARAGRVVQTFEQTAAGIGTISDDLRTARVLVFGIETTTRGGGAPSTERVTLTATMIRRGDRYLISRLVAGENPGIPSGVPALAQAAELARRHTVAALTLRRESLAADYTAALANTVDPLRATLVTSLGKLRRDVQTGRAELTGRVTAIGIERTTGRQVVALLAATGYRSAPDRATKVTDLQLRVTVVLTGAGWVVTDSQAVTE